MNWLNPFGKSATMAKDPVCGMNVNTDKTKLVVQTGGKSYYFCAPACMEAFTADPAKYLAGGAPGMAGTDDSSEHSGHGGMGSGKRHGCC